MVAAVRNDTLTPWLVAKGVDIGGLGAYAPGTIPSSPTRPSLPAISNRSPARSAGDSGHERRGDQPNRYPKISAPSLRWVISALLASSRANLTACWSFSTRSVSSLTRLAGSAPENLMVRQ